MQNPTAQTGKKEGIFLYLFFLTGFFLLLEISFFIQCNRTYLSDFTFVTNSLHIPTTILPGVAYFIFVQLLLHFVYCLCVSIMTISVAHLFKLPVNKKLPLGIGIWILGIATILI